MSTPARGHASNKLEVFFFRHITSGESPNMRADIFATHRSTAPWHLREESCELPVRLFVRARTAIRQGQKRVAGHKIRIAFHPTIVVVGPRSVRALNANELIDQVCAPVVRDALLVDKRVLPERL